MKSYHRDGKRVKTKERTKYVKSYNLMRQEEIGRQCEEFFISLDNEDMEGDSHEEDVSFEPKFDVEEGKTRNLKVSFLKETGNAFTVVSGLSCSCEDCMEELYSQGLGEPTSCEFDQPMTMVGDERLKGPSQEEQDGGSDNISYSTVHMLLFHYINNFGLKNPL